MMAFTTHPPSRRPELVMGPPGPDGQRVVKDPRTGRYYNLGEQETFLLGQLDGARTDEAIRAAFEAEFGEPLSDEDLGDFLEMAREEGLLQGAEGGANHPPSRRPELVMGPPGPDGQCVVKDPRTGRYYNFGEQETFLLEQLDGARTDEAIRAAFEAEFGEPLSNEDLGDFLEMAREEGLLQGAEGGATADGARAAGPARLEDEDDEDASPSRGRRQSLLFWRMTLFDPDQLFNWLEPKLRFVWTRPFLVASAGCIVAAAVMVWTDRQEIVAHLPALLRWEIVALAWVTLVTATLLHEFAHGLTCKHHGGEVHEIGFLLMYFMPCLFCNVSDAWMIPEKSKRIWVTAAGGYCDLFVWALATFAWRLTLPGTLPNHLAWLVLSVCGARIFFNFNPLLKLDGYYILSDLVEIPNLRRRSLELVMGHLRWLLWGAARPSPEPRGRFLLGFGIMSWLYSLFFLGLMLAGMGRLLNPGLGPIAIGFTLFMVMVSVRYRFRGIFAGEVAKMIRMRRKRCAMWALGLGALPVVLTVGQIEQRVGGSFQLRPATRAELRAPVAGFLKEVAFDEGDRVSAGQLIAGMEVPDLTSRLAQKHAESCEARAKLRLLEIGPRPEERAEQRRRVERAKAWWDLAQHDLTRKRQAFQDELASLDHQIAQHRAELDYAEYALELSRKLMDKGALSREQYREAEMKRLACLAQGEQAKAQRHARLAEGTLGAEAELAHREKQWAEDRSTLVLLEAGTRPEEVEAARAHLARVEAEVRYLEGLRDKLVITSPVSGVITTPRLKERVGRFLNEGQPICTVETLANLEAEIAVTEQDVLRVRPGQEINLRARSLPFQTLNGRVERIAPRTPEGPDPNAAVPGREGQGASAADLGKKPESVIIYCRLDGSPWGLQPGMTGYARIHCGRRPIGEILAFHVRRFLRTEFWW